MRNKTAPREFTGELIKPPYARVKLLIKNGKIKKRLKISGINQKHTKDYEKKNDNIMTPMTKTNEETNYISRMKAPLATPPLKKSEKQRKNRHLRH